MTKLVLAASDVVVVPCPIDTAEFSVCQTPDATMFSGVRALRRRHDSDAGAGTLARSRLQDDLL